MELHEGIERRERTKPTGPKHWMFRDRGAFIKQGSVLIVVNDFNYKKGMQQWQFSLDFFSDLILWSVFFLRNTDQTSFGDVD